MGNVRKPVLDAHVSRAMIAERRERRDARIRAERIEFAMAEMDDKPPTDDIEFGPGRDTRAWRGGRPGSGDADDLPDVTLGEHEQPCFCCRPAPDMSGASRRLSSGFRPPCHLGPDLTQVRPMAILAKSAQGPTGFRTLR